MHRQRVPSTAKLDKERVWVSMSPFVVMKATTYGVKSMKTEFLRSHVLSNRDPVDHDDGSGGVPATPAPSDIKIDTATSADHSKV